MSIGFAQILSSLVELFGVIYTSGFLIWDWLSSPLTESGYDSVLGELASYTPLELMFGPAVILILVLALIKFVTKGIG